MTSEETIKKIKRQKIWKTVAKVNAWICLFVLIIGLITPDPSLIAFGFIFGLMNTFSVWANTQVINILKDHLTSLGSSARQDKINKLYGR